MERVTVAILHQMLIAAIKRIDEVEGETKALRKAKHEHAGIIHNHSGILSVLPDSMADLKRSIDKQAVKTEKNTSTLHDFQTIIKTGLWVGGVMGSVIAGLLSFIGGTLMEWW